MVTFTTRSSVEPAASRAGHAPAAPYRCERSACAWRAPPAMMATSNACARRRRRTARDARVIEPLARHGRRPRRDSTRPRTEGAILPRPSGLAELRYPGRAAMASVDDDAHRGRSRPPGERSDGPRKAEDHPEVRASYATEYGSARGRGSTRELLRPGAGVRVRGDTPSHPRAPYHDGRPLARGDGVCARPGQGRSGGGGVPEGLEPDPQARAAAEPRAAPGMSRATPPALSPRTAR